MSKVHCFTREPRCKPISVMYLHSNQLILFFKTCILCPNEGGAFKQTIMGEWVHLLCAIWVPETRVANDVFMEPITGVDKISKQRWKLVR
jgi:hypothetical protein